MESVLYGFFMDSNGFYNFGFASGPLQDEDEDENEEADDIRFKGNSGNDQKNFSMDVFPYMRHNWTLFCLLQVVHH